MSEETIIKNCSPTLAGLKTANLFSCAYENKEELLRQVEEIRRILLKKGVDIKILRIRKSTALVYVYRPMLLKKSICRGEIMDFLDKRGYKSFSEEACINTLATRLKNDEFPHEIGVFLGYPFEDILGFIKNGGDNYKLCGYWKVYGDRISAQKTFAKFKKCTDVYCRKFKEGSTIQRLTVAV